MVYHARKTIPRAKMSSNTKLSSQSEVVCMYYHVLLCIITCDINPKHV